MNWRMTSMASGTRSQKAAAMGRYRPVVFSQPASEDITALEDAMARGLEMAPIRFVDGLVMTKNANDEICFVSVCDIGDPDRAWRGLIAQAFFGRGPCAMSHGEHRTPRMSRTMPSI